MKEGFTVRDAIVKGWKKSSSFGLECRCCKYTVVVVVGRTQWRPYGGSDFHLFLSLLVLLVHTLVYIGATILSRIPFFVCVCCILAAFDKLSSTYQVK